MVRGVEGKADGLERIAENSWEKKVRRPFRKEAEGVGHLLITDLEFH